MYLKNAWYVACMSNEVAAKPLGRRICGKRMVFYRAPGGKVAALEDFCPHRGAPLSLGFLREGVIVCGYHGLTLGADGKCRSMPGQRVGAFPSVRAYPVLEHGGYIWVWPGDAAMADPAKLHPMPWADSDEWAYGAGLFHVKCDFRLMVDNLMDLTHEAYVHPGSIGQHEIEEAPVRTKVEGDDVVTSRFMNDITPPSFWLTGLRASLRNNDLPAETRVDRWQICRFSPPSHIMIQVGVALAGQGGFEAPANVKASSIVVDFVTPETDTTMWYFWGMARNFNVKDELLTETIRQGQHEIFSEDLAILEQQQQNHLEFPDRRLMRLNIDSGGFQSRRVLERLLAEERNDALGEVAAQARAAGGA